MNIVKRTLGWGGGYTDEPISKILISLQHAGIVLNIYFLENMIKGIVES